MVDYVLVKRNNHIFVVVYRGTVRPSSIAVDVRNISFPIHMWQKLCVVSVILWKIIYKYYVVKQIDYNHARVSRDVSRTINVSMMSQGPLMQFLKLI